MSQDERMTSEELEFLAKRNKAINFKEELTPQKEARVFKAYQDALPVFKSSLICVNGLIDGVEVDLIDYDLLELDATNFNGENQERSILFSFSTGSNQPNYFIIIPQHELDKVVKGDYTETLHQLAVVLKKYYLAITKDFPEPLDVKAVRVEELGDAVRNNPTLIEGDYEVKYFELNKNGIPMSMQLLADINVMTILYDGIMTLDSMPKKEEVASENNTESIEDDILTNDDVIEEEGVVEEELSSPQNSIETYSSSTVTVVKESEIPIMEGNVMKKEIIEEENAALYKPKFGALNPTGVVKDALGELGLLGGVPMDITVVLGSTKALLSEVKDFGVGKIIELNKSEDDPLLIYLNGELLAEGEVVIVDENYAIKITKLYQEKVIKTGM